MESVECEGSSVERGVGVWSVECKVWSGNRSVKCGV